MKARKRQIAFYKGWGRMAVKRGRAVSRMKRVVDDSPWRCTIGIRPKHWIF